MVWDYKEIDWGFTVGEVLQAFLKVTFHLRGKFEYLELF